MKRFLAIFGAAAPHFFCCVLPWILSFGALGAAGAAAIEKFMPWVFAFGGVMIAVSAVLTWRKCPCDDCGHRTQKIVVIIAAAIYAIGLAAHFFTK